MKGECVSVCRGGVISDGFLLLLLLFLGFFAVQSICHYLTPPLPEKKSDHWIEFRKF